MERLRALHRWSKNFAHVCLHRIFGGALIEAEVSGRIRSTGENKTIVIKRWVSDTAMTLLQEQFRRELADAISEDDDWIN